MVAAVRFLSLASKRKTRERERPGYFNFWFSGYIQCQISPVRIPTLFLLCKNVFGLIVFFLVGFDLLLFYWKIEHYIGLTLKQFPMSHHSTYVVKIVKK